MVFYFFRGSATHRVHRVKRRLSLAYMRPGTARKLFYEKAVKYFLWIKSELLLSGLHIL